MALVLDTGVVYAALFRDDPDHGRCAELLVDTDEQLVVPSPVLVELDYWLGRAGALDAWLAFSEDVSAGAYALWPADATLLVKAARLQQRFADQPIGFVDAAVFSTCEALGEDKVCTLDRRRFGVLRGEGGAALRLLPD